MLIIWRNAISSKGDILFQGLVDGILWQMNDFGRMQDAVLVEAISHDFEKGEVFIDGTIIRKDLRNLH